LHPITIGISKQLIPIYDKPMIYYPLSVLMLAGITDILVITTSFDAQAFKRLLGDGQKLGCRFQYAVQEKPNGIAETFVIGETFIGNNSVALILGDNIFYGDGLRDMLKRCVNPNGGIVFAYHVSDPNRYGVLELDKNGNVLSVEEKPKHPKSNFAVTGLYFYDNFVVSVAKKLKPSKRGEYEITDINNYYLKKGLLKAETLCRGNAWLDTGTFSSLIDASQFIHVMEKRQGLRIGCIEEVAYRMGYINKKQLQGLAKPLLKSGYGTYLMSVADEDLLYSLD
ncbi:MAG: glucose-1-phosphate thymidylyltransferase RfbA, partial [Patescibacteria group bacterium]